MKNMHVIATLLLLLLMVGLGNAYASEKEIEFAERLKAMYPNTRFKAIRQSEFPGIYEVVMGNNIAYVESSGRYFLFGHVFDMAEQRDLSQERMDKEGTVSFAALPLKDAIVTLRGDGSRKMVVFSDPDCGYCRQLESNMSVLNNVTIYTFLMPLVALHPDAFRKAVNIWCSSSPAEAWKSFMAGSGEVLPSGNCDNPIQRNIDLALSLAINGTPTIIFEDGRKAPGAMSGDALERFLIEAAKGAK